VRQVPQPVCADGLNRAQRTFPNIQLGHKHGPGIPAAIEPQLRKDARALCALTHITNEIERHWLGSFHTLVELSRPLRFLLRYVAILTYNKERLK